MKLLADDVFRYSLRLLHDLELARIHYEIRRSRPDAVSLDIRVPGQHWEIEFVQYDDDIHIEIERFTSDGEIDDEVKLKELFHNFADYPHSPSALEAILAERKQDNK